MPLLCRCLAGVKAVLYDRDITGGDSSQLRHNIGETILQYYLSPTSGLLESRLSATGRTQIEVFRPFAGGFRVLTKLTASILLRI